MHQQIFLPIMIDVQNYTDSQAKKLLQCQYKIFDSLCCYHKVVHDSYERGEMPCYMKDHRLQVNWNKIRERQNRLVLIQSQHPKDYVSLYKQIHQFQVECQQDDEGLILFINKMTKTL